MKCTCVRCGKEFEAKHKTAVCADCHTAVCVVCGKEFELQWPWTQVTCSSKCRGEYRKSSGISASVAAKAKSTMQTRYGVSNPSALQHFTRTCKWCGKEFETTSARQEYCNDIHYGPCPVCGKLVEIKEMYVGPQACSEECRQQRIQSTCMSKYGNTNVLNSEHGRTLSKQSCLNKYGVDHYSKSSEYREKYEATMLRRYGTRIPLKSSKILDKLRQTCLNKYGVMYNCMRLECRTSYRTISKINQAFCELLTQQNIDYIAEFSISKYSYDVKCSDVLVEIDPTITHNNELSIFPDTSPTTSDYHINKSNLANANGYRCIHVFDWDRWDKIIELLKPTTAIYARQCEVMRISKSDADKFTAEYHIQGRCNGQKLNYGIFCQGELISVMTFGSPRYNKQYDFELLRLCSKYGLRVVGGASKMFKQFLQDNPNKSVISYCDRAKFTGDVYAKIGMQLCNTTAPNKIWSKGNRYITQNLLNQRGYDQLFGTDYGKGTSNEQLMLDNGWLPVYDCGQAVYEFKS